ncbi:MAG: hypothetical protein R3330_18765 [Saprospiraceae bacterium]|nr:hypothetical protein [Saprospiraceae bacterium]
MIVGLLITLMACSTPQPTSQDGQAFDSGLLIENGPSHGLGCTDSLGATCGLVYRTVVLTNDSIVPMDVRLAVPEKYAYPMEHGEQTFRLYLWPGLTAPQVTDLDTIQNAMENFVGKTAGTTRVMDRSLAPGEQYVLTIGTLFSRPPEICSVVAYTLFTDDGSGLFPSCDRPASPKPSSVATASGNQVPLGLMVGFCTRGNEYQHCTIIPCGYLSYSER